MTKASDDDTIDIEFCRQLYRDYSASVLEELQHPKSRVVRLIYADLLAKLSSFVEAAASTDERPFVPMVEPSGETNYHASVLAKTYFLRVPDFIRIIGMLSSRYSYCEHIEAFIEGCTSLGLNKTNTIRENDWQPAIINPELGKNCADIFNDLCAILKRDWAEKGHKARFQRRRREALQRAESYRAYVKAWFAKLVTLIVLRVDLYYKSDHWAEITLDNLAADFNHLYNNFRCNKIFRGLRGYITKIEYGLGKGFHMHVIFLFDTEHKNAIRHVHHAKMIGEYWVDTITKGRGAYWNCNSKAKEFAAKGILGIGPIDGRDENTVNNLLFRVVDYLCKMDQFIRPKGTESRHLNRHGKWPRPEQKKRGRPRKDRPIILANKSDVVMADLAEEVDALGF